MDRADEASTLHLRTMVWAHAVLGVVLFVGFCGAVYALAGVGGDAAILAMLAFELIWMLGVVPIRREARKLPPEVLQADPEPLPERFLKFVGIVQFWSVCAAFGEWPMLIIPANILVGATLVIVIIVSSIVDLPLHRESWGKLLGFLLAGTIWNLGGGFFILAVRFL